MLSFGASLILGESMEEGTDGPFGEITNNGDMEEPQESMADESMTQETEDLPSVNDDLPPSPTKIDLPKAQEELSSLDVLVCGKCHNVFHFIPELEEHKQSGCPGVSTVFSNSTKNDPKAQVWAFVLYKVSKLREHGTSGDWSQMSWKCYQKWSKLSDQVKQSWVEAGRTLQAISQYLPKDSPQQAAPLKKSKPLTAAEKQQEQQTLLELQKELEDEVVPNALPQGLARSKDDKKPGPNQVWVKTKTTEGDSEEFELRNIEKIVAKRVNPKQKTPEYLIKWEGMPSDENTWEPVQNMTNCMMLVQEFEKNLAKQKARKAAEANKQLLANANKPQQYVIQDIGHNIPSGSSPARPIRTSAKKALDQVKEWVKKRPLDSEEEDGDLDEYEPPAKKESPGADISAMLRKKIGVKSPLLLANTGGVVRVDPKSVPNLSSGVYILSSQQGLIKVDDPTAAKLTEAMKVDGRKVQNEKTMMIHETEIRKIPAATPKVQTIYKKDVTTRKNNILSASSPGLKLVPKTVQQRAANIVRVNPPKPTTATISRQIVLGNTKPRPLPGPVNSPLRPPIVRQRTVAKPVMTPIRQKTQILQQHLRQVTKVVKEEEDFDGGIPDEFPKGDEPIQPSSPTRPLTLCPLSGEVLGRAEGEKTPPPPEAEDPHPVSDEDGMMRVEMSPGGTIRQVLSTAPKARSLLSHKRGNKTQQQVVEAPQDEEMISIESEDGVIYQITPEQQQILLQNGTLTMQDKSEDGTVVLPQETLSEDNSEILIENGQIVQRVITGSGGTEQVQDEEQEMLLSGQQLIEGEDGQMYSTGGNMLTLDSAVQEAVSQGEMAEAVKTEDNGQQMVAQIVQAEPPSPSGGPRKVVLLLPDGSLVNTEMDEEQYQALEFEK